jgi:hypothetical protein
MVKEVDYQINDKKLTPMVTRELINTVQLPVMHGTKHEIFRWLGASGPKLSDVTEWQFINGGRIQYSSTPCHSPFPCGCGTALQYK